MLPPHSIPLHISVPPLSLPLFSEDLEFESQRQASILQALESTGGTTGANKFVKVLLNSPTPPFSLPSSPPFPPISEGLEFESQRQASILQALESTGGMTGANKFVKVLFNTPPHSPPYFYTSPTPSLSLLQASPPPLLTPFPSISEDKEFESQRQASILQALESTGGTTGANKFVKVGPTSII